MAWSRRRATALITIAVFLAVAFIAVSLRSDHPAAPAAAERGWAPSADPERQDPLAESSAMPGTTLSTEGAFAPSLAGTSEDGGLVVDENGRFVPSPDAIDLFDYYLATLGERTEEQIHAQIVSVIHRRLGAQAEAEKAALDLLDGYFEYRTRAAAWFEGRVGSEDLERRLQTLRELRREIFGASVARALFGEEEARWFADLERRRIATDPNLDATERDERYAALLESLPPEMIEAQALSQAHTLLRREEARLRAEGGTDDEVSLLREERLGASAAKRLSDLDASRARWQARFDAYRRERREILVDAPATERSALIEALRARHFDEHERVRVRALDRAERESKS